MIDMKTKEEISNMGREELEQYALSLSGARESYEYYKGLAERYRQMLETVKFVSDTYQKLSVR